ncbi:hypothetical protein L6258_02780 [Candidatus Parcubacteria bacterium]|nr:hypothetical protein [Candidatus Parcubacteria bacterium]
MREALVYLAAELNGVGPEEIRESLKQGQPVLCPVRHYQSGSDGKLVKSQPVSHTWDISKPTTIEFWDNNWGGGISSGVRIVIDVIDNALSLRIWVRDDDLAFNNRWSGTSSVLESLWRVSLQGRQSEADPWDWRKPIIISLVGVWGPESTPLVNISKPLY